MAPEGPQRATEGRPADYREERLRAALLARSETLRAAIASAEVALRDVRALLDQIEHD